ncbi:MAG TPA: peptidyl-prolyl cis-trans isomerase, partial [Candidatus Polarisedimenticolia bacterium]
MTAQAGDARRERRATAVRGLQPGLRLGPAFLAVALACGCGGRGTAPAPSGQAPGVTAAPGASQAPDPGSVATVGGEAIPYKSFERYLADNATDGEGQGEQDDVIKSRLLDQFLEEQLLVRAAARQKVTVAETEVDAYLKEIGVSEGEADAAGSDGKQAFRDKVRQGILMQKVKDEAVLSKVQVTPGEVDDYIKKQPELQHKARSVVLRQILVDDKALADRLRAGLQTDPTRFEAVARENSVASDHGQARGYSEEDLPIELRQPVFDLEPGQVSPVIENAQRFLIFQMVRKEDAKSADPGEVRRRVQLDLFQKKGEEALDRFIADLKKET